MLNKEIKKNIERFREVRISNIEHGNYETESIQIYGAPKVILHIIPFMALDDSINNYDVKRFNRDEFLRPIDFDRLSRCDSILINFDGVFRIDGKKTSYVQIYRNGIVEAANSTLLDVSEIAEDHNMSPFIPFDRFKDALTSAVGNYTALLRSVDVKPPVYICLTICGVKGYTIAFGEATIKGRPIDRNQLLIPAVEITDFSERTMNEHFLQTNKILNPLFDYVLNAAGLSGVSSS